jgi:class 3 adenylate cyclase/predicted ATPase
MNLLDVVREVRRHLEENGRLSLRILRRQFELNDDALEEVIEELVEVRGVARREEQVLAWSGTAAAEPRCTEVATSPAARDPLSYTPKHLAERILAEQAAMESRGAQDGERKTITALFADIKGSVEMMEGLDPEEARAIVDPALQLMMDAVHRYEGYVAQSRGDGIFAVFGAPIAQEDHSRRALYAALRMQEDIKRYSDRLRIEKGVQLAIRVGLNSGEMVLRAIRKDDLHTDYVPIGHSVNLAARMEGLATPGTIAVAESTYRVTVGYFRFRELGPIAVKGVSDPIRVYELEGMGALHTPLEVSRSRGFSRFVGRRDEIAALEAAIARAIGGSAQVVGIVGEPGVGKSRLCFEFLERCRSRGLAIFEAHGVPHGKALPLLPMLELFRNFFGITEQDPDQVAREKIAGKCVLLDESLREVLPLVFDLLGVSDPERPAPPMDRKSRQRQLAAMVKRVTQMWGRRQPAVTFLEDLQWFDGGSEAFLEAIVAALPGTQTLVLVNFRPEYHAAWMQRSYYQQLPLLPLGLEAIAELLTDLLGRDPSVDVLAGRIRERTSGNPFFIEETVQALAETGSLQGVKGAYRLARAAAELRLPATVQAVLAARIDRLTGREKQVLETAAVIGREFTEPVLQRVVELSEIDLTAALQKLTSAEFVYEEALYPQAQYTFKHALTQEVAYNSLLSERRLTLHEQVAEAIAAVFEGRLEEHLSDLARHYSHSRNVEKAIEYSQRAGERAVELSANAEAISHLTTALKLLDLLPDSPERIEQELALRIALGVPLITTKGYSAPEVEDTYARARELCVRAGDTPRLFPVLRGLWFFNSNRGYLRSAQELAEQLLALGESTRDPSLLVEAHLACGLTLLFAGDLVPARDHLEQGIHLYDPQIQRSHAFLYGQDPGIYSTSILAAALWTLGYPDRALAKCNEALALARDLAHPFSLVLALVHAATVHYLRREPQLAERRADAVIALSAERGLSFWSWWALIVRGWAVAQQERGAEGIAQIREGLAAVKAVRGENALPLALGLVAEALGNESRAEEALNVLAEALAVSRKTGDQFYDAEIYRLKGGLLLASSRAGNRTEAESCFRRAVEIARRQQAKSLELRAVTSLARLLHHQGKREEAWQMLAEIYSWFTEGFDTADLKDAKVLLEELS